MSIVPSVLHEFAHHETFDTPVGSAVAGLLVSAALRLRQGGVGQQNRAKSELMRHDYAQEVLRPLIEGIALFAEFDTNHRGLIVGRLRGSGNKIFRYSRSMIAMWNMFSISSEELMGLPEALGRRPQDLPRVFMAEKMRSVRLSDQVVGRKLNVYGMPLGRPGHGYLLGYMAVKRLWRRLSYRVSAFNLEPDLFLVYLIEFIFHDYKLVALLLDESFTQTDPKSFRDSIESHLSERLWTFAKEVTTDVVVDWYRPVLNKYGGLEFSKDPANIRVRAYDEIMGRSHHSRFFGHLINSSRHPIWGQKNRLVLDTLSQRRFGLIARVPVQFNLEDKILRVRDSGGLLLYEAESNSLENFALQAGEVDVYLVTTPGVEGRFYFLHIENRLLASWELLAPKQSQMGSAGIYEGVALSRDATEGFEELLDQIGSDLVEARQEWKLEDERISKVWLNLYGSFALFPESGRRLEAGLKLMMKDGIYDVLGGDRQMLRTLAYVGLLESVSEPGSMSIAGLSEVLSFDCQNTIDDIVRRQAKAGLVVLLTTSGGRVQSIL